MSTVSAYLYTALIIAFIVYRRIKKTIGFQKLRPNLLLFRTILFGAIGLLLLAFGFLHPIHFVADLIGLAGGIGLALLAIRHTRFEQRSDGWYYVTHLWIQITVLILFLSRVIYRIFIVANVANLDPTTPLDPSQFSKDPLTVGIFFIIVSYYVLYFGYLIREEKKLVNSTISPLSISK
ncbi:hypothetical protein D3C73_578330 [compost metagenome]